MNLFFILYVIVYNRVYNQIFKSFYIIFKWFYTINYILIMLNNKLPKID